MADRINYKDAEQALEEYLYKSDEERKFFEDYGDGDIEFILLYQAMKAIHFGYFEAFELGVPSKTQKIPTSKEWKEHIKFEPKNKTPRRHGQR